MEKFSTGWPPGFKSALVVDKRTGRFETDFARAQRNRDAGGWDSHPVIQPGSRDYVKHGPVLMMAKKG